MPGRFEVYEDKAGKFRFRLKASNGQVVATGEAYETKAAAKKGCESVEKAAGRVGDGVTIVDLDRPGPRGPVVERQLAASRAEIGYHHGLGPFLTVDHREHCLGCQAFDRWRVGHPEAGGGRTCYEFRDEWIDALRSLTHLFTRDELDDLTRDEPLTLLRAVDAVRSKYAGIDAAITDTRTWHVINDDIGNIFIETTTAVGERDLIAAVDGGPHGGNTEARRRAEQIVAEHARSTRIAPPATTDPSPTTREAP